MMAFERPLPSSFGKDRLSGETWSYIFGLACVPIVFWMIPGFTVWFAFQRFDVIKYKKFKDKYGRIYSGFRYGTFAQRLSPYIFVLRRQIIIMCILSMKNIS